MLEIPSQNRVVIPASIPELALSHLTPQYNWEESKKFIWGGEEGVGEYCLKKVEYP